MPITVIGRRLSTDATTQHFRQVQQFDMLNTVTRRAGLARLLQATNPNEPTTATRMARRYGTLTYAKWIRTHEDTR